MATVGCRPIDIVVPFYRNAPLADQLFRSVSAVAEELIALRCSIIVINDSPDDGKLTDVLHDRVADLSGKVSCTLIENERNLGFVQSINTGLGLAREHRHDVLLLNSDTRLVPGAVTEMCRVLTADPMIAKSGRH